LALFSGADMARPTKNMETSRLNLELAMPVRRRIEEIRDQTHADSLGEVVRRALELYSFVLDEQKAGRRIFTGDDEKVSQVKFL
jgi:hypothetical protein